MEGNAGLAAARCARVCAPGTGEVAQLEGTPRGGRARCERRRDGGGRERRRTRGRGVLMGADAKWVQDVMADWSDPVFPEYCQQFACNQPVQTWCPLCRAFFCDMHDELYPR